MMSSVLRRMIADNCDFSSSFLISLVLDGVDMECMNDSCARDLNRLVSLLLDADPTRGVTRGWYFTIVRLPDCNESVPSASEWCVLSFFSTRACSSGVNGSSLSSTRLLLVFLLLLLLSGVGATFSYQWNTFIHTHAYVHT